jgi:hypothetical protein
MCRTVNPIVLFDMERFLAARRVVRSRGFDPIAIVVITINPVPIVLSDMERFLAALGVSAGCRKKIACFVFLTVQPSGRWAS